MHNYISSKEAAELLGIHPTTLQVWRHRNKINIPYIKVGRAVLYNLDDIENYLQQYVDRMLEEIENKSQTLD